MQQREQDTESQAGVHGSPGEQRSPSLLHRLRGGCVGERAWGAERETQGCASAQTVDGRCQV